MEAGFGASRAGEIGAAARNRDVDSLALERQFIHGERDWRMRDVDNCADALFLEPFCSDGCGGRNVVPMVTGVNLDGRVEDLATKILDRHSRGFKGTLAAKIPVQ